MGGNGYVLEDSPDLRLQTHELAHYLSNFVLLRQPRWLAEGLARYLETIHVKPSTNEVVLGRVSGWDLGYVKREADTRSPTPSQWAPVVLRASAASTYRSGLPRMRRRRLFASAARIAARR